MVDPFKGDRHYMFIHPRIHQCGAGVWRLLAATVACLFGGACSKEKPAPPPAPQAGYLEVYSIRKAPDETHSIPIEGPSRTIWWRGTGPARNDPDEIAPLPAEGRARTVWYREATPAFDLNDFLFADTWGGTCGNQLCADIPVKPAKGDALEVWTRQQVGEWIGFVVDGQLVQVAEIKAEISRSLLLVTEDDDVARLKSMFEAIKSGGVVPASSQPSQQPIATRRSGP